MPHHSSLVPPTKAKPTASIHQRKLSSNAATSKIRWVEKDPVHTAELKPTSRLRLRVSGLRDRLPRIPRPRIPRIRKPPQIVRWDLLGVALSYLWGAINNIPLPVWLRRFVYTLWAYMFHVNLTELKYPLETYPTLRDFFSRPLKDGARNIDTEGMASPVDGRVVIFGEVKHDRVEQVKGMTYPMSGFLGIPFSHIKRHPDSKLYHCVLYLAPGDYHRIHSPTTWSIAKRRHFPGTLFPISPSFARWIPNLFAMNERVVLVGDWSEGFYSLTAVGAYNVGSISLNFEQEVRTNVITRDFRCPNLRFLTFSGLGTHAYDKEYEQPVTAEPGEEIALFNLGSTVVLVFEAKNFNFTVKTGQKIKLGEQLGTVLQGVEEAGTTTSN